MSMSSAGEVSEKLFKFQLRKSDLQLSGIMNFYLQTCSNRVGRLSQTSGLMVLSRSLRLTVEAERSLDSDE